MSRGDGRGGGGGDASDVIPRNVVAIFHASFHPTKGNTTDWSLTSSPSIDLSGVEFSVLPSGLHLVERDVVYFTHGSYAGLAVFRRRATKSKAHRGFRLASLGILLEEGRRPRPWMHLEELRSLADVVYADADRREKELEDGSEDLLGLGVGVGGFGAPGDLREEDFEPARRWFEARRVSGDGKIGKTAPADAWSGWSDELDGTYASKATPTHHLPHLLRILGLSSLTLYKFVLSRRRILIYTLPPVEVAGVLAWIASDLCREHHMAPRSPSHLLGTPIPSLFKDSISTTKEEVQGNEEEDDRPPESPTVLGMITLSDLARLEQESAKGRGWIACTTDAIFMEKPQYYDLIIDLTTSTPSKASRPNLYMSKSIQTGGTAIASGRKKKEKWKLESVRFTWSDVKLWTELDRILKLDSSQVSSHSHSHPSASSCCLPKSPSSGGGASAQGVGVWTDAFKLYEDVCLLCATLWMGLGTWRSNSRQSFASRDLDNQGRSSMRTGGGGGRAWGAAHAPGDEDWSLEGTHMRTLGMGIEGNPALRRKDKDKGRENDVGITTTKIRAIGMGIEGRPSPSPRVRSKSQTYGLGLGSGSGHAHSRKASASSTQSAPTTSMKIPVQGTASYVECIDENDEDNEHEVQGEGVGAGAGVEGGELFEEDAEELRRQNVQTTLALLQTFHANTVFWLSKLREVLPPPSSTPTPSPGPPRLSPSSSHAYTRVSDHENEDEQDGEEEEETLTITARDLMSLELGVLSELDARFVEWLVEAEGYASPPPSVFSSTSPSSRRGSGKRRVVVKRGWQELFGILLGLK